MAGKIKQIAKQVAKAGVAAVVPGGAALKATLDVKGSRNKIACQKKGGKWVKGRCVDTRFDKQGRPIGGPSKESRDRLTGTRTGRKKHPGTGDWYPEKG